ncbi:MAG: hypothetical protein LBJ95_04930 [Oscillospiraceae bacterium]|jgi:hypothetical protein|nr:hypothetical protein [Oscillospiraceae bacterium]
MKITNYIKKFAALTFAITIGTSCLLPQSIACRATEVTAILAAKQTPGGRSLLSITLGTTTPPPSKATAVHICAQCPDPNHPPNYPPWLPLTKDRYFSTTNDGVVRLNEDGYKTCVVGQLGARWSVTIQVIYLKGWEYTYEVTQITADGEETLIESGNIKLP